MPKLQILKPGMLSTIQDNGRLKYIGSGVPMGGALDKLSYWLGNALVGNDIHIPAIEITLLGPTIEIQNDATIAITGANLSPKVNREDLPMNTKCKVAAGSILSFGKCISGCRSYLAVKGQWKVSEWLGSASPLLMSGDNRPDFGPLRAGRVIEVIDNNSYSSIKTQVEVNPIVNKEGVIRVMKGPEYHLFNKESIDSFTMNHYKISPVSNRMGYRLIGTPLLMEDLPEMISSGVVPGTVQISNAGLPIIIMADGQTVGGYPRIANVLTEDQYTLAQMKPGELVKFEFKD